MDTMYTRRTVLALGGASLLALALPMPALALTEGQARGLIDGLVGEINSVIASGEINTQTFFAAAHGQLVVEV